MFILAVFQQMAEQVLEIVRRKFIAEIRQLHCAGILEGIRGRVNLHQRTLMLADRTNNELQGIAFRVNTKAIYISEAPSSNPPGFLLLHCYIGNLRCVREHGLGPFGIRCTDHTKQLLICRHAGELPILPNDNGG